MFLYRLNFIVCLSLLLSLPIGCGDSIVPGAVQPRAGANDDGETLVGNEETPELGPESAFNFAIDSAVAQQRTVDTLLDWTNHGDEENPGYDGIVTGNMTCIGNNLPEPAAGERISVSGTTIYYGSPVLAPGAEVTLYSGSGQLITSTVSDDRGQFTLEFEDTDEARSGSIETYRPGGFPARIASTHPGKLWGKELELRVISSIEVSIMEVAAGLLMDRDRGFMHGIIVDCDGETGVANARVSIEPSGDVIFYATDSFGLADTVGRTSPTSQFFAFNLEPGTYVVTISGELEPGAGETVINEVVFDVTAGSLSSMIIHPE
jgi:hypothetical protein